MSENVDRDVRRTLDAWREQGNDRFDSTRFHFIDALARRADDYSGGARRVLDEKLTALVAAYAQDLDKQGREKRKVGGEMAEADKGADTKAALPSSKRTGFGPDKAPSPRGHNSGAVGALGGLVDGINALRHADSRGGLAGGDDVPPPAYPELALLDFFRETWSRLGTKRQLRQSLAHVPENAGPLNSSLLVHRTLSLMREASPEYLHQFLTYVDALSWMEQAAAGGSPAEKDAPRVVPRKSARGGAK